jgi:hypothetical protein
MPLILIQSRSQPTSYPAEIKARQTLHQVIKDTVSSATFETLYLRRKPAASSSLTHSARIDLPGLVNKASRSS